jgi:hypothetical protein
VAFVIFWHRTLSITGPWSVGAVAAIGGAAVAVLGFSAGRIGLRMEGPRRPSKGSERRERRLHDPGQKLRWYELTAIALAHGAVALALSGLAALLEAGFRDARSSRSRAPCSSPSRSPSPPTSTSVRSR